MLSAPTTRDFLADQARAFLIDRVVEHAAREGKPLSEVEKRVIRFSETMDRNADFEACKEIEAQTSTQAFESKISKLVKRAYAFDKKQGKASEWYQALQALKGYDFYLLVMVGQAGLRVPISTKALLPRGKELAVLVASALVFVGGVYALFYFRNHDRVQLAVFICCVLTIWGISRIRTM